MTEQMVSLTIDGQEVKCPAGATVYEAATAVGIHIPTFCNHEKLEPVGACRMCLVEIEGARGLQTSCTTPVREGMVVKVHTSPAAVKARKANIEFLLTNHPLDCPVCDKGGECLLQDQAMLDGPGQSRYIEEKRHKEKHYPLSDLIMLDQERCVLCWRCIRFLDEWADDHQLDLFGRGADTRIDTYPGRALDSKWQGNTIDLCPVGALTSRIFRFEARVWELTNVPSVCTLCSVGCNTVLGVKNNSLRRITPRENGEVNDVWLCDKGRFAHGFVEHPDRLTQPLIRREGELQAASWEEALDLVASRLGETIEAHGPDAVAGLGSTRASNEANYLLQRFMRAVVGTNNVAHLERMPEGATLLASLPELEHRDVVLLLGCDPSTETPLVELWLKKAVLRHGARLLIANPRQIELGRYGGPWLGYRPGSEVALLNGLAHLLLAAGGEGPGIRVANLDDFRASLADYGPRQAARLTGVDEGQLRATADLLAGARRPAILYGPVWTAGRRGKANLSALSNLALLLGNVETGFLPGDGNAVGALEMGVVPNLYPGRQPFDDNRVRGRLASLWGARLSPVPGLDFEGMVAAAQKGDLQALWVMGADPVWDNGEAAAVLGDLSFLVVQDLFMTATARQADVVLPAASFAEKAGSVINLTGRIQALRPAIRPPGRARPDWQIVVDVARRMVQGKQRKAWLFDSADDVLREIKRTIPALRDMDQAALAEGGWQHPAPAAAAPRALTLVEADVAAVSSEYPFFLVTGRVLYDRGTLLSHSAKIQGLIPEPFAVVHPSDADRLGLTEGDEVAVVAARGRFTCRLRVRPDVAPGVVFVPRNLGAEPVSALFGDGRSLPRVRLER